MKLYACRAELTGVQYCMSSCSLRIPLNTNAAAVSAVVALRPVLEELIEWACDEPENLAEPTEQNQALISIVRGLCRPDAATYGVDNSQDSTTTAGYSETLSIYCKTKYFSGQNIIVFCSNQQYF